MSECVVRMEMPENCETCPLRINNSPTNVPDWICAINQWPTFYCKKSQNHADEDKYLQDCPIICLLPEGHGRLGDLDALADDVRSLWDYKTVDGITATTVLNQTLTDIRNCPTIVPAERSET